MFSRCTALLAAVLALHASPSLAYDIEISGTFTADYATGTTTLSAILGHANSFRVVLRGVSQSHSVEPGGFGDDKVTRVHATSFDFLFEGVNASQLQTEVGSQLIRGGLGGGAVFELRAGEFGNRDVRLYLFPTDPSEGVYFQVLGVTDTLPLDPGGYPIFRASSSAAVATLFDTRGSGSANLGTTSAENATLSVTSGCDWTSAGDGTVHVSCFDGTEHVLDQSACSITQNANGSATLTCDDGSTFTVSSGQDGSSCSVTENADGTATIACTDGTSYIVHDGTNGESCSVSQNADGTATMTCPDGTSATFGQRAGCSAVAASPLPFALLALALGVRRKTRAGKSHRGPVRL